MSFYTTDQTERSRSVLDQLVALVPTATLIGGWGTWVRLYGQMSHDIDLIVSHDDLTLLRAQLGDFSTSDHVGGKKYRGDFNRIHVDLYVPHQSRLGNKLQLRVEDLTQDCESVNGYNVLSVEAHIATKFAALLDRPDSLPGEKDRYEIIGLMESFAADPLKVRTIIERATSHTPTSLNDLMNDLAKYLLEYRPDVSHGGLSREQKKMIQSFGSAISIPLSPGLADLQFPIYPESGVAFVGPYTKRNGQRIKGYPNPKQKRL